MNANRIGLGPPKRDDYLVQEMMAVMREASRERGARYEILWLNVVVEPPLVGDRVHPTKRRKWSLLCQWAHV